MMRLKKDVKEKRELVNIVIDRFLPRKDEYPKVLHKAMRHTLFAGGKRVRPYLTITTYQLFGHMDKKILPLAAALELLHTYTLIHDDLPDLDDDEKRRGKPSSHIEFGENIALLTGDALLLEAFKMMLMVDADADFKAKLIKEFAEVSGSEGLIGGQVADIECEHKDFTADEIDFIHLNKTAKMLTTSVRYGAMLANAREDDIKRVTEYGNLIGLMFQIVDDILDIEGDVHKLGKKTGTDIRGGKATYPKLYGMKKTKEIVNDLKTRAKDIIGYYGPKAEYLQKICEYITTRRF